MLMSGYTLTDDEALDRAKGKIAQQVTRRELASGIMPFSKNNFKCVSKPPSFCAMCDFAIVSFFLPRSILTISMCVRACVCVSCLDTAMIITSDHHHHKIVHAHTHAHTHAHARTHTRTHTHTHTHTHTQGAQVDLRRRSCVVFTQDRSTRAFSYALACQSSPDNRLGRQARSTRRPSTSIRAVVCDTRTL
jgi:hypothetical protein